MDKTPQQLADGLVGLSEEYSRYSGELASLIKAHALFFKENRPKYKSDTATDRAFDLTEDGVKKTIIGLKLKSIAKTMSGHKTMIEVKTNEARGLY